MMESTCTCTCEKCQHCLYKEQPEASKTTTVGVTLWLNNWERASIVEFYNNMLANYEKTTTLLYSNILERFDGYREEVSKDFLKRYGDPEDINYDDVGSTASDKVEQDLLMHYQYHFSQLVNLYHVFEQQIRRKLYQELNHNMSSVRTKEVMRDFATKFGDVKGLLKELNYPMGNQAWRGIDELNKIANTYKHGDGNSAIRLDSTFFVNEANRHFNYEEPRTKEEERTYRLSLTEMERDKYDENVENKILNRELTTSLAITLRPDKTPYEKYIKVVKSFWETFPEHLVSNLEVELSEEEVK